MTLARRPSWNGLTINIEEGDLLNRICCVVAVFAFAAGVQGAPGLASPDFSERKAALLELAEAGEDAVPDIARALHDHHFVVRRTAARLLGERIGESAKGALEAALQNHDGHVRRFALAGLENTGQVTLEHLAEALDDADPVVRAEAVRVLGRIRPRTDQVTEMIYSVSEGDPRRVREAFFEAALSPEEPVGRIAPESTEVVQTIELPLDGWRFRLDPEERGIGFQPGEGWWLEDHDDSEWDVVEIGQHWQRFGHDYQGVAWYRLAFDLPEAGGESRAAIHFEGVDESGWVWLNGQFAGSQDMGPAVWDAPFTLDITRAVRWGARNQLAVRVKNAILGGGIWRPVSIQRFQEVAEEQ